MSLKFNKIYFTLAVLLFGFEILIAKFAHDPIIRPYVGDVLVSILIYCFVKSFLPSPVLPTALGVLLFSYAIEVMQYFQIVNRLGLQNSKMASTVIGTSFEWIDLIAYTVGIAIVLYLEKVINKPTES
ncbi:DUF2809 domain-containing protein [Spirosoma endbachense]|uniref:DUF2809 domain-containing protein n=1 Tax=Spirosoma endbachense TaxID=2666025 RepID=A0A6P1W9H6_9BACT|nr:DUF2809 domain-containing protein [Spirosoma endbachense]